jgi:predicted nucleotidyltransferase component of viral defense system
LEKAVRLAAFLAEVADDPFLADRLALKGGTALNLYHGALERLSVDADLNYIGQLDRAAMEAERGPLFDRIEALAREMDYGVKVDLDEPAARAYHLRYTAANDNKDLIKLDINLLERAPVLLPIERRTPPDLLEIEGPPVPCQQLPEVAGSKLATLMLRGACRDLFDVATLAARRNLDWALTRKVALFHGFLADVGLGTMRPDRAQEVALADYNAELRNRLPKGEEVSLDALRAAAAPVVEAVLQLDDDEEACRKALLKGEWTPKLLFGDYAVNPQLKRHPGMEWHLRNPHARMPR